ncbi:MAG: phage protease [Opitutaceae bacterium]
MNTRILNRAGEIPADGWYEIETPGEHVNRAAGAVQVLDEKAFASIVNRFAAEAAQPNFAGLLVDQDHFSLDPEKSSESFGWLMEVRNREGRLEGRVEWTDLGEPAVKAKRYKYFSTVYEPEDLEVIGTRKVKNRNLKLVRPLRLDRLALTNDPNNKGGKPISNREEREGIQPTPSKMKKVTDELGLPEDASEDAILEAIRKLKTSVGSAKAETAAVTNRATAAEAERDTLKAERGELLAAQAEADLDKHAGVIANRDAMKTQLIANRKATLEILESLKKPAADAGNTRITNRSQAKTPAGSPADETAEEKTQRIAAARAARVTNRARKIREATSGMPLAASYQAAEAEITAEESGA